jgi:two-component system copper resistance phosphate regulon response regulator CusR
MRILIIEDDKEVSQFLKMSLEAESFIVDVAPDGEKGSYVARCENYDLILLDYLLPKKDGFEVCQELRKNGITAPIIMVSVKKETPLKVGLLNLGADDYITKPFLFDELLARIRAVLRRQPTLKPTILTIGDLTLEPAAQRTIKGRKEVYLTRKEFILLEYLLENRGKVVSRGMILEHVWNRESDPFSNTIEAHILNLRKKIDSGKKKLIHTVPGRGYKIEQQPA